MVASAEAQGPLQLKPGALKRLANSIDPTEEHRMTFKKGEQVLTEDGEVGEILFVDRGGLEAQVALNK